jgi:hypothetical protein
MAHQRSCSATTAEGALEHFASLFRQSVVSSHRRAGCPIAGIVVDTYLDEEGSGRSAVRASVHGRASSGAN